MEERQNLFMQEENSPSSGDKKNVKQELEKEEISHQVQFNQQVSVFPKSLLLLRLKKPPLKFVILGIFFLIIITALFFWAKRFKSSTGGTPFGKKGEIVWWGIQHDGSVYTPLIEEFEKTKNGVKVVYKKQSPQDYRERLMNSLKQGKGPDIFEIHNTWPSMFKDELSTLPSSIMSKEEFSSSFYPLIVSDLTITNSIVAFPLEFDVLTLFVNDDIFAAAAKEPPKSWVELRDLSAVLTQRLGEKGRIIQAGVALGETQNVDYWPEILGLLLFQNRVNPADPSKGPTASIFSFYKYFKDNRIWDWTLPSSVSAFAKGRLAMFFGPTREAFNIAKENPNLRFRTVRLPQLPKNSPQDPDFSYATYWVNGVWNKSQNKEIAWEFLKFLAEKESLRKINDNIAKTETFRRLYPRPDMNVSFNEDPILGSAVSLAFSAKSFFLADKTFDGENGINSQINSAYEEFLNTKDGDIRILEGLSQKISKILSSFDISQR